MRRKFERLGICLLFVPQGLCACAGGASSAQSPRDAATAQPAQDAKETPDALALAGKAEREGKFQTAVRHYGDALARGNQEAGIRLGRLQLLLGQARAALETLRDDDSVAAVVCKARALRSIGEVAEGLSLLADRKQALLSDRQWLALWRGDFLIELGRRREAEEPLLFAAEQGTVIANRDEKVAVAALFRAGRAAHLLREAELANELFNRAEIAGGRSLELLLARFDLYLDKHDVVHAEGVLSEIAEQHPHHPEVLFAEARLHMEAALDFAKAAELADRILVINPHSSDARFVHAGSSLRDLDFEAAERHVRAALDFNPRDLRALSMRAAVRFLAEDKQGFEAVVEQTLKLSPGYSELFNIVGQFAEWEHRYPDIQRLMRRAARLDPQDAKARTLLGLTLVRWGSDAAGVVELQRAYQLDPFNVRVVNTLNLYERTIVERHVDVSDGPFRFRYPKEEKDLLERYVPALMKQAHDEMQARYDYTPPTPIGVEIYESQDAFAVRTSGLPRTPIAGVCFGRKLATVSPVGAPGNLGMTLWHELGHVFHIGLSEYRVPRWLTEGMAEWETAARGVGWSRELDRELLQTMKADALPPLRDMTQAFTHARHQQDVASAYYASGLVSEWLVETRGIEAPVAVLRGLGEERLPDVVVPEALGASWQELDRGFRTWLHQHLARFEEQFVPALVRSSVDELEAVVKKNPEDEDARVRLGHAVLAEGEVKRAHQLLTSVKNYHAQASYLLARIALATGKLDEGAALLAKMAQRGDDGYELRMVLGRILLAQKKETEAERAFARAAEFDAKAEEPLGLLSSIYRKRNDREAELRVLTQWAPLAEHAGFVHRRLLTLLIEEERLQEAADWAKNAVWSDLADVDTHRIAALALSRAGRQRDAAFEWESALYCPGTPAQFQELEASWISELERTGQREKVAAVRARIAETVERWNHKVN